MSIPPLKVAVLDLGWPRGEASGSTGHKLLMALDKAEAMAGGAAVTSALAMDNDPAAQALARKTDGSTLRIRDQFMNLMLQVRQEIAERDAEIARLKAEAASK